MICLRKNASFFIPYGVAMISRPLKIIGLFCKRALKKRRYSAKETYNFKEPTNRSHPIARPVNQLCCVSTAGHNSKIAALSRGNVALLRN